MVTHPLRLAALLTRSFRGQHVGPMHRAGDRLLRPVGTDAEVAEALALWRACGEDPDPVGATLGLIRVLCEDQPRGIGLDRAVTHCATRSGRDVRESAGRAILAAHAARRAA